MWGGGGAYANLWEALIVFRIQFSINSWDEKKKKTKLRFSDSPGVKPWSARSRILSFDVCVEMHSTGCTLMKRAGRLAEISDCLILL